MEYSESGENIREEKRMHKECVSVCMACYNGEKYIEEQIATILPQLNTEDELIIVDDHSSDKTAELIKGIEDARIRYVFNQKNLGVNASFEKAIKMAKNDYIFMADQDDLWTEKRLVHMLARLKKYMLVSGNSIAVDAAGKEKEFDLGALYQADSGAYGKNITKIFTGKAYYYGCAMAFRRELTKVILPFPAYMESHDLWIAMAANMLKSNCHLEKIVLKRRIHGENASVIQRKLWKKIYSRFIFLKSYVVLRRRIKKSGI